MATYRVYRLSEGVQVRNEKFGLLFYNYRGPRLYFLPSRDLLDESFFNGQRPLESVIETIHARHGWPLQWIRQQLADILMKLENKGLIHEQSLC
jgi:putative mycofactocin binding protein MftB